MIRDIRENLYTDNIAEILDENTLKDIGKAVVTGFDDDMMSRSDWEERLSDYLALAAQIVEAKNTPWPSAANVKFPILTEAALQFAARANIALFPGFDIVKGKVIGKDPTGQKRERAIRVGKHMSFQLLEQMEDWEDDMDKLLHVIPIVGCAFKKTYYDPIKQQNISELVLPQDLVVDYWAKSLESAWRISQKLNINKNTVYENQASGIWLDIELNKDTQPATNDISNKIQGRSPSKADESTPNLFIEQHTYWDLDEDGYAEPYIITVHYETGKVVRILARYDEDGIKESRDDPEKVGKIDPVHYFTKYGFIPNPDGGFYDFGFGLYLYGINHTVNTTINQLLDAGTLATQAGGFLGRGAKLEGGNYSFKPMEWKTVRSTGDDLRKNIMPLPVREPSSVLFNLLGLMIQSAQRLAGTIDSMVGENPGQNQKATTTQLVMAEGLRVFHSIYKREYRSLKKEFKKLYRLNRLYLDPEEYINVIDPVSEQEAQIMRNDYEDQTLDIMPAADPTISNEQQKMQQSQALMQTMQMFPGMVNPQEVLIRSLEAQNQPSPERLMEVPPPQPSLEQLQFQAERQDKEREFQLKVMEYRDKASVNRATIIEKLAKAESLEKGDQFNMLMGYLDKVLESETAFEAALDKQIERQQSKEETPEDETDETATQGMA